MLIAICFWGLLRALPYTLHTIFENIYTPLQSRGHQIHVHIHTYKSRRRYQSIKYREFAEHINTSLANRLNPDYLMIDDQDEFDSKTDFRSYVSQGDAWKDKLYSLKNHIRALYSLSRVGESIKNTNKKYDVVIFLRPDVYLLNKVPVLLLEDLALQKKEQIYLPDFHRSCSGGEYNDRFAAGSLNSMLLYANRYHDARQYSLKQAVHSETFLYDYLNSYNASVLEIPFRFRRIRMGGFTHRRDNLVISPERQLYYPRSKPSSLTKLLFPTNPLDPANIFCSPNPRLSVYSIDYSIYFKPATVGDNVDES